MITRRRLISTATICSLVPMTGRVQESSPEASPVATPDIDEEQADDILDALTPTPTSDADEARVDIAALDGYVDHERVFFELEDTSFSEFPDGLSTFGAAGIELETVDHAERAVDELIAANIEFFTRDEALGDDWPILSLDTTDLSIGRLGDQRAATLITYELDTEALDSFVVAVAAIRQEQWVQLLVGYGVSGVPEGLTAIAEALLDRWPSDNLADMLPTLEDLPPGMAIVED